MWTPSIGFHPIKLPANEQRCQRDFGSRWQSAGEDFLQRQSMCTLLQRTTLVCASSLSIPPSQAKKAPSELLPSTHQLCEAQKTPDRFLCQRTKCRARWKPIISLSECDGYVLGRKIVKLGTGSAHSSASTIATIQAALAADIDSSAITIQMLGPQRFLRATFRPLTIETRRSRSPR